MKPRAIALVAACLLIASALFLGWINLGTWLARSDSLRASEVIVCLSGEERIKKAARLFHQGLAPQIILTVAREKKPLAQLGVPEGRITLAPGPLTTYQEALAVAPILRQGGYRTALVVTDPYHLRRVRWTFEHVLKDQPISISFLATDLPWEGEGWWKHKEEKLRVYSEVSKLTWYWLAHGLLRMTDDPPWSIELKRRYESWLNNWVKGGG